MRPTTVGMRRAIRWPWLCDLVQPRSSVISIFTPEIASAGEGVGIGAAPELAVGDDLQADVLLQLDYAGNGLIFDPPQRLAIEFTGRVLRSRAQEVRRPQQASDMFGSEGGRAGHSRAPRRHGV